MGAELSSSTGEKDLGVSVDSKLFQSNGGGGVAKKVLRLHWRSLDTGCGTPDSGKTEKHPEGSYSAGLETSCARDGVVRGVEEGGGWKSWIAYTSLGSTGGYRQHLWLPWSRRLCVGAAKSLCQSLNRTTHGIVWLRHLLISELSGHLGEGLSVAQQG